MIISRYDWEVHPLIEDVTDAIERGRIEHKIGQSKYPRPEARLALHAVASYIEEEAWPPEADPALVSKILRMAADTLMNS